MSPSCLACDRESEDRHHPTGRGDDGSYLDAWFRIGLCHDDHELVHDDMRAAGLEVATGPGKFLDTLELSLRRLGVFLGRIQGGAFETLVRSLARWCGEKAEDVRCVIAALDAGQPAWRQLPGMP